MNKNALWDVCGQQKTHIAASRDKGVRHQIGQEFVDIWPWAFNSKQKMLHNGSLEKEFIFYNGGFGG